MLTRQFRSENERLKEELTTKIQIEVQNLNKSFNNLKKDTELELIKVRVEERVNAHATETNRQIDRISQEVNAKSKILMADILEHRCQVDVNAAREVFVYVKEQVDDEFITEIRNVSVQ